MIFHCACCKPQFQITKAQDYCENSVGKDKLTSTKNLLIFRVRNKHDWKSLKGRMGEVRSFEENRCIIQKTIRCELTPDGNN
jgi:hypothetical protein